MHKAIILIYVDLNIQFNFFEDISMYLCRMQMKVSTRTFARIIYQTRKKTAESEKQLTKFPEMFNAAAYFSFFQFHRVFILLIILLNLNAIIY